jgi:hypothetical protein
MDEQSKTDFLKNVDSLKINIIEGLTHLSFSLTLFKVFDKILNPGDEKSDEYQSILKRLKDLTQDFYDPLEKPND